MNSQSFVSVILALQFAVFGWRINREISIGDEGRKTWLLVADYLNFASMIAVVALCIVLPLGTSAFSKVSEICIAVASVLIVFYPIILAGHYRLFSAKGRAIYIDQGRDYPLVTDQEAVLLIIALLLAGIAGYFVAR